MLLQFLRDSNATVPLFFKEFMEKHQERIKQRIKSARKQTDLVMAKRMQKLAM